MKNLSRILLSAGLVLSTTSCTAAEAEVCEMCGRAVCVCNGVVNPEEPKDPEENNGTEKPAPVPTGSNFVTLRNGRMTAPDGTEVRLWGVNFQTPISWEYNRLKNVGIAKTAASLNQVAMNNMEDLHMVGVNHLRCHLTPSDLTDGNGNLLENSVYLDALDYIWANPEIGYKEWKTHKYLKDAFEKLGYTLCGSFLPPDQEARELMYRKELKA